MKAPDPVALHLAGRLDEAEAAYISALAAPGLNAAGRAGLLRNYGILLHQRHRFREAVTALQEAGRHLPADVDLWATLGQCCREMDDHRNALAAFQKAAALAPEREDVTALLSGYLARVIPGWHLPMLADEQRNLAYEAAIARAVPGRACVLDIGTGSGLLSLLAVRHGAKQVFACEANPLIAQAAREIVARNHASDKIRVITKRSTELQPDSDLPQPADLVVSEILDAGLLGEGVLPTLRDALARLAERDAKVIPGRAEIFCQALALPELRHVNPVRRIAGFDLSPFDRFRSRAGHASLRLDQAVHQVLSAPFPVAQIDFHHPPDWQRPRQDTLTCAITRDGTLQAFALWFDLWLDDATCVTTAPAALGRPWPRMVHWGQAVIWLPHDRIVTAGETLTLSRTCADSYIDLQLA